MVNVWSYWKCNYCLSINRGDNRTCQNCGCSIPVGVKFLMPDNPQVIEAIHNGTAYIKPNLPLTESKIFSDVPEELVTTKANWICGKCFSQNKFEKETCESCGASKELATEDYFGNLLTKKESENDNKDICIIDIKESKKDDCTVEIEKETEKNSIDDTSAIKKELNEIASEENDIKKKEYSNDPVIKEKSENEIFYDVQSISSKSNSSLNKENRIKECIQNNKKFILLLSAMFFVLVLFIFLGWVFYPVTRTGKVQSFEWYRSIGVEEFKVYHEKGWSLPSNAHVTSTQREIHHHDKVVDHYVTKTRIIKEKVVDHYDTTYRDLGNGQTSKSEKPVYKTVEKTETYEEPVYKNVPVYRTRYYYDIGRWTKIDSLNTKGTDKNPYWYKIDFPPSDSNPNYGDKKQTSKSENYYAYVINDKNISTKVEFDYTLWENLSINTKVSYKTTRFSNTPSEKGHLA